MTSTPRNGNSWWMGYLRQKCLLSGRGRGEYGLYNLSNVVKNILALNLKGLYLIVEKKRKETCFLLFTYSLKRVHEIRMFHVPVLQWWLRKVLKSICSFGASGLAIVQQNQLQL